jgi:hypothetical protein
MTMDLVLQIFGIIVGLVPWVLMILCTKNRKCWLWWYRSKWKGTLALTLSCFGAKVVGYGLTYQILMGIHQDSPSPFNPTDLGVIDYGSFSPPVAILNFPESIPVILIFNRFEPDMTLSSTMTAMVLLDLLLVYLYFSAVLSCKTYFAKRAYEIER